MSVKIASVSQKLPLLNQSIANITKLLREGTISSKYLCQLCLKRIETTKKLNAFITVNDNLAIQQSTDADKRFEKGEFFK